VGPQIKMIENDLGSLRAIPDVISEISESNISVDKIKNFGKGFAEFDKLLSENKISFSPKAIGALSALVPQSIMANMGLQSISSIVSSFDTLTDEMSGFTTKGRAANLPVVRGIKQLVAASNAINKELSSIEKIDIKTKVENLGKVLGLKGTNKIQIEHKNFNVNVGVTVKLDPTDLAEAILDTKMVMKSTYK